MVLKSEFRFRIIPALGVRALDDSDLSMVGYLLELCCESPPTGAIMMMRWPSSMRSPQVLPLISG
jgi:hypothetical protein